MENHSLRDTTMVITGASRLAATLAVATAGLYAWQQRPDSATRPQQ